MKKLQVVLLTGVQGTGKSTIGVMLAGQPGLDVADLGTLLFEILGPVYRLKSRDQLRDLPAAVMAAALPEALAQLNVTNPHSLLVLVTHVLPRRLGYYYFPQNYSPVGAHLSGIIILMADPIELLRRRQKDAGRSRAPADAALLKVEQERYLTAALLMAAEFKIPCWAVNNGRGTHQHAATVIGKAIKQLDQNGSTSNE